MAKLPDPTSSLEGADRKAFAQVTAVRSHAEGRTTQSGVYLALFNNPAVAERIAALGEQIRFHGVLPGRVRELAILRYASHVGVEYEWSHHQRPAHLEGIDDITIAAITKGDVPADLPAGEQAMLRAVDATVERKSIPYQDQDALIDAYGTAGTVEIVAICGLYAVMSYAVAAFDVQIEDGLPTPPF